MEQENKRQFRRVYYSNQSGTSLIFVLMTSFLLISLVTIVIRFSNTDIRSAAKQENQTKAYYIAEAGLEEATFMVNKRLEEGLEPPSSLPTTNFQNGIFEVEIQKKLNEYNEKIGYDIISIGKFKGEEKTLTSWVREPIWEPGTGEPIPDPLKYTIFADKEINIKTSSLISLPILLPKIKVAGDVHANFSMPVIVHTGLLAPKPEITGNKSTAPPKIPMPQFDFDSARKKALEDENSVYKSSDGGTKLNLNVSLLEFDENSNYIFIDGDVKLLNVEVDLLNILPKGLTIVVNGKLDVTEVSISLLSSPKPLNLIAKEGISLTGIDTDFSMNGILFSQGEIFSNHPLKVRGYTAAENINLTAGILDSPLGNFNFAYDENVFSSLPSGIGFKQNKVELIEQKESADNVEE